MRYQGEQHASDAWHQNSVQTWHELRMDAQSFQSELARERSRMTQLQSSSAAPHSRALYAARDKTRLISIQGWSTEAAAKEQVASSIQTVHDSTYHSQGIYKVAHVGGSKPQALGTQAAGTVILDMFSIWWPLVWPVSKFNIRNGRQFNDHPGCVCTVVLTGRGRISTYAVWRTTEDFLDAFHRATGHAVKSTQDINDYAAKLTRGLMRPDYHVYDLVELKESA